MHLRFSGFPRGARSLFPLLLLVLNAGCLGSVYIGGDDGGGGAGGAPSGGGASATVAGSGAGSPGGSTSGTGSSGSTASGSGSSGSTGSGSGTGTLTDSCLAIACGGDLVDPSANPHHCGGCDHDCGPNMGCHGGQCVSAAGSCFTCAEFITDPEAHPDWPLCPALSQGFYDDLTACVCGPVCGAACGDNICATCGSVSPDCQTCVTSVANGCGAQFNDCANDF